LRQLFQNYIIQGRKGFSGRLYEMQVAHQGIIGSNSKHPNNGFVYLLHQLGTLLGYKNRELSKADQVIKKLIECIHSIDTTLDYPMGKKAEKATPLISSLITVLMSVKSSFGENTFLEVCEVLDQYIFRIAPQVLKEESISLAGANHGIFSSDSELVVMQEKRNFDLLLYSEIYFKLLDFPTRLRPTLLRGLKCFGVIDITIDDLADLDEDYLSGSYNIFLIKLARRMRLKKYSQINRKEVKKLIRETGIIRRVYWLLLPYKNRLGAGTLPVELRAYLNKIINEKYELLKKQIKYFYQNLT